MVRLILTCAVNIYFKAEGNREAVREAGGLEVLAHLMRTPILPKSESINQTDPSDPTSKPANDEASFMSSAVWAVEALSVNGMLIA